MENTQPTKKHGKLTGKKHGKSTGKKAWKITQMTRKHRNTR